MKLQLGQNTCSNQEYHADLSWFSSSKLKLILEDPAAFHAQVILGQAKESAAAPNLDEGSLFHSYILEPHLVDQEYAFFPGLRKAGPEFEEFKAQNPGKPIISAAQHGRVLHWVRGYRRNAIATELMKTGQPELSLCLLLDNVPVKIRADFIDPDRGIIVDLKTTAFPVDPDSFRMTCKQWNYFLSGALYTMVASKHFDKPFSFYFSATCKKDGETQVYKMGERSMLQGQTEVLKALQLYKQCVKTGLWIKGTEERKNQEEILEI